MFMRKFSSHRDVINDLLASLRNLNLSGMIGYPYIDCSCEDDRDNAEGMTH
jgi:hypothetical protein